VLGRVLDRHVWLSLTSQNLAAGARMYSTAALPFRSTLALQAVLMPLELREAIGALTATWSRLGHEIGFGIGIAHGFATLGAIGFEGRFDYAAIGTVSNVASRLCNEAKPGQILISPRVLMKVEKAVKVEPVGEFEFKGSGGLWRPTMCVPSPKAGATVAWQGSPLNVVLAQDYRPLRTWHSLHYCFAQSVCRTKRRERNNIAGRRFRD
jgi:Adenylate and Guanylate cyclase catalytic domain